MNGLLDWGLGVVSSVQTFQSPALTAAMKAVTFFGSEYAYLLMLPLVYWCVDERKGFRLGVAFLFSAWLNAFLKLAWKQPRPYDFDPSVGLARETSFGFPSMHAQGPVTFWGVVGSWLRRPYGLLLAVFVPLIVGFSRVYLGVHFPTDVLAGWGFGLVVLALYFAFGSLIEAVFAAAHARVRLIAVAAVALAMNALHPQDVALAGAFLGMGFGYILMRLKFPFSAALGGGGRPARAAARMLRLIPGLAVAGALYIGLKAIFPGEASSYYRLFRFLRYGALGFWVAAGAPWLFLKLKLAGAPTHAAGE